MTTIYYLTTVFFLWLELRWMTSPIEKTKDAKAFNELSKLNKGKKWDTYSKEYKDQIYSKLSYIIVMVWLFVGLFTFQWTLFLGMLIFNFLIIAPISKLTRYSIAYTLLHWINSVIGFAFGIFVIINHYHLKIDLLKYFTELVNF